MKTRISNAPNSQGEPYPPFKRCGVTRPPRPRAALRRRCFTTHLSTPAHDPDPGFASM